MKYKNSKKEKLHYEAVFLHEEKRKEIIDYSNTSIKGVVVKDVLQGSIIFLSIFHRHIFPVKPT